MSKKKKLSKKAKVAKVFFILSLAPYAIILIYALWGAVFGYFDPPLLPSVGGGSTLYGWKAFTTIIFWSGLGFSIIIPILPLCLIYQIIYIIVKIVKKKRG